MSGGTLEHALAEVSSLWQRLGAAGAARAAHADGGPPVMPSTAEENAAPGAIDHAVAVYGLDPIERDVLVLLLGLALGVPGERRARDLRAGDLVEALATDRARALHVLAALQPAAPLSSYRLLDWRGDGARLDRTVALADAFWPRLVGIPCRDALVPAPVEEDAAALAVRADVRAALDETIAWLAHRREAWPTVAVVGPAGSGRGAVARACCRALGLPAIAVDGAALDADTIATLRREVGWHQAAAIVHDADQAPPGRLATLAADLAGPLMVTSGAPVTEKLLARGRALHTLELPRLGADERAGIWARRLAAAGLAEAPIDTAFLGARFGFAPARIAAAAAALSPTDGGAPALAPDTDAAVRLCRTLPEVRVGNLATRLDTAYGWDDLVLPPAARRELELIVTWGRHAPTLFAAGAPGRRARPPNGLACLFHGPSGTGKTLAAQVIAATLGLELYRVDLAAVVDKYIGETEKRLDLLFREAEAAGVILLFDEADALFTQRTEVRDARDRYANMETGFLLQRLEDHRGLTILASNHQRNVDTAFHRRLGVIVELPLPTPPDRVAIWKKLLPPGAIADADLDFLSSRGDLSGGDIRNAVVFATLFARSRDEALATPHLVVAIWRELTRAARLVDAADFGPWQASIVAHHAGPVLRSVP